MTSGTTHSINLVAFGFGTLLSPSDEVIVSAFRASRQHRALANDVNEVVLFYVIPMTDEGTLDMHAYAELLNKKTKLVFVNHVSNALGTINPIKEIIKKAHKTGAAVLVDGAQACGHLKPNLKKLDVDFYTVSAHKLCGPTGTGMLYGKEKWLNKLPPYQGGGEMIDEVTFENTTYADLPHKFESGTPYICGGIAFGAALDYMNSIGFDAIESYEEELLDYATGKLNQIEGLCIYGNTKHKTAVISFNIDSLHPMTLVPSSIKWGLLFEQVITVHNLLWIITRFQAPFVASFAFYNTKDEVDSFVNGVQRAIAMLR